jgi:hypothetical protein
MGNFLESLPLWIYIIPYFLHIYSVKYLLNLSLSKKYNTQNLYDIIASNTTNLNKYSYLINYLCMLFILPFIFQFKINYLISFFKYYSLILFIRAILTNVTVLPSCLSENCEDYKDYGWYKYINGHCNDKIFSGHVAKSIIAVYLIYKNKLLSTPLMYCAYLLLFIISILIVMVRWHYTIDVLIAYIISGLIICYAPNL